MSADPLGDLRSAAAAFVDSLRLAPEVPVEVADLAEVLGRSNSDTDPRRTVLDLRALLEAAHEPARLSASWVTPERFEAGRRAAIAHDRLLDALGGPR